MNLVFGLSAFGGFVPEFVARRTRSQAMRSRTKFITTLKCTARSKWFEVKLFRERGFVNAMRRHQVTFSVCLMRVTDYRDTQQASFRISRHQTSIDRRHDEVSDYQVGTSQRGANARERVN